MCGIVGIVYFRDPPGAAAEAALLRARDLLTHRGPDDAGFYRSPDGRCLLAHRRLSIVDLSPQGRQPMTNEDGSLWVVFNGEIYNQLALRKQLLERGHQFRSRSDTEVLLHLYEDEGEEMVSRVEGEFAFVIYDQNKHTLFAVRDRLGVKPLFYSASERRFAFASEPKALLALPDVNRAIRAEEIETYLTFNCLPGPETLHQEIQKVEPAHFISVSADGSTKIRNYWLPGEVTGDTDHDVPARFKKLTDSLRTAASDRMMSDVPLGGALSGGMDSSLVVTYMSEVSEQPVHTFTIGYPGDQENQESDLHYARLIAQRIKSEHEEIIFSDEKVERTLEDLIVISDDPIGSPSVTANLHLAQFVKSRGVTVIQVGEGGDELFAGYEPVWRLYDIRRRLLPLARVIPHGSVAFLYPALRPLLFMLRNPSLIDSYDGTVIEQLRRYGLNQHLHWGYGCLFCQAELDLLRDLPPRKDQYQHVAQRIARIPSFSERHYLDQVCLIEIMLGLPERLLMRVDRASMASGVEARVPFLDAQVLKATFSIPPEVRGRFPKAGIKQAAARDLPKEILTRKHFGFPTAQKTFLAPRVFGRIRESVSRGAFLDMIPLGRSRLQAYIDRILQDPHKNFYRIWSLFILSLWHRHWGSGK